MRGLWAELAATTTFYTRLPLSWTGMGSDDVATVPLARACRFAPLAGALIGLLAGIAAAVAMAVGLPGSVAALAATLITLLVTGALHEDGLADAADAMGASGRDRRIDIMRDSNIGTYGAIALWFSLSSRTVCIAFLLEAGAGVAAVALIAVHAMSRMAALYLPYDLPAARPDGASAAFGRPDQRTFREGLLLAVAIGALGTWIAAGLVAALLALSVAAAIAIAMSRLSWRYFGGQTGDLIGASQQVVEVALLALLTIFV